MTTITKERLLTIKQWRETYGPGSNVVLPAEEAEELARVALASLEADPVKRVNSDQMHRVCLEANRYLDKYDAMAKEVNKLLGRIAPPVPVVPEEIPKGLAGQIVSLLAHNIGDKFLAQKIWNACRTAMLNGDIFRENSISPTNNFREIAETSTNSPVILEGWISCSERMPEDEQEVIVHNKLGYRYVSYFDEHSGLFFDMRGGNQMNCIEHILVTHWMPLPAAPQQ